MRAGACAGLPLRGKVGRAPCWPNLHQLEARLKRRPQLQGSATQPKTTLNNGYLGSRNDEERSEMRYVV